MPKTDLEKALLAALNKVEDAVEQTIALRNQIKQACEIIGTEKYGSFEINDRGRRSFLKIWDRDGQLLVSREFSNA